MYLICPICKQLLVKKDNSFFCENHHQFDQAKSGYINLYLTNKSKHHGDNKEMINARTSFLSKDYYLPLKAKIVSILNELKPSTIVDLACGEGYYTQDFPAMTKFGFDLSKDALQRASKNDKSTQYCVASIFDCPIESNSIDCITTIFAPIANDEISRMLKVGGTFIGVFPAENHLFELKQALYTEPYLNEKPQVTLPLTPVDSVRLTQTITCTSNEDIQNLFLMTPYYYKTSIQDKEKINCLQSLTCTIDFYILIYRKDC